MKKKKEHFTASPVEYRNTVEAEFSFLNDKYGYTLSWSKNNPFEAVYTKNDIKIKITGISYGFGAMVSIISYEEEIPFWTLTTKMNKRFTPATDKPQLDDLREYSHRLRNECQDILTGDFSRVDVARNILDEQRKKIDAERKADAKGMFFSKADKLWKNEDYKNLNTHLNKTPYELSKIWQKRFEYSKKHV